MYLFLAKSCCVPSSRLYCNALDAELSLPTRQCATVAKALSIAVGNAERNSNALLQVTRTCAKTQRLLPGLATQSPRTRPLSAHKRCVLRNTRPRRDLQRAWHPPPQPAFGQSCWAASARQPDAWSVLVRSINCSPPQEAVQASRAPYRGSSSSLLTPRAVQMM